MSSKYDPPKFIDNTYEYPEYKKKLQRWSRITKVDKKLQADVVVYHMEGHPSCIQDKIETSLGDTIIGQDDGLTKLIAYLDTIYAEDELTDAWLNYKKIIRLKKTTDQPITEFIADFERIYKKAKDSGSDFSDLVLAFNLLEACVLSEIDEKFVISAIDYKTGKEKKSLFEQTKNSLRKFKSREKLSYEPVDEPSDNLMKKEESYVSNVKETLISEGWRPPRRNVTSNNENKKTRKNPLGKNGKPLQCFRCRSEFHMLDNCDQKRVPSNKSKEDSNKGRKEQTMLSSVLKKLENSNDIDYTMMCCVYEDNEDSEVVLVSQNEEDLCYLIDEAGCRGVLDSACSNTVAGSKWISKYTQSISPTFAESLEVVASTKIYEFGGGEKRKSQGAVKLPALIGDKKVTILVNIVQADIPLLIGSNSMKVAAAKLDFESNKAIFFDEEVDMYEVGSGHFCIDLSSKTLDTHINNIQDRDSQVQRALVAADGIDEKGLKKLHHLYGHTSAEKLEKFLRKAGKDTTGTKNTLEKIEKSCESCLKSKRRKPLPKSAIPRVERPNQIVTLDLKEFKNGYICYIIDMHSRFTAADFISNKNPDTLVNCIMHKWVSVFGVMEGLHSDLGGEMTNELLDEVASKMDIKITTTSSYSPHQNGLNERNHAIIDLMITKMLASDSSLTPEIALCWGLNAKNSLENCYGFTPVQLQIGKTPILPSVTRNGPPLYSNETKSESFAKHLNAMNVARQEFIKAESSSALKKALKSRVHPRGHDIMEGDWIYYRKNDKIKKNVIWKGPSKVISINGKKMFVDQGARLGTVNRDDAVKQGEELWTIDELQGHRAFEDIRNDEKNESRVTRSKAVSQQVQVSRNVNTSDSSSESEYEEERNVNPCDSSSESEYEEEINEYGDIEQGTIKEDRREHVEEDDSNEQDSSLESEYEEEINECGDSEQVSITEDEGENVEEEYSNEHEKVVEDVENAEALDINRDMHQDNVETVNTEDENVEEEHYEDLLETSVDVSEISRGTYEQFSYIKVKMGDIIEYRDPESGEVSKVTVMSRAGKSTGLNKHWWNVKDCENEVQMSVNLSRMEDLVKVEEPHVHALVVTVPRYLHKEPECVAAKEAELKNWEDFHVFEEVEDVGQPTINTSWVLVKKETGVKARLCIRGDQEPDKDQIKTDSPMVNKVNVKLFYAVAISHGWTVQSADVKAAFLQGTEIDRDIYVRPPKERRVPGRLWKMIKRAYGFVDASRGFYVKLDKVLQQLGCEVISLDQAMYVYHKSDGSLGGMLMTHVDDFLHGSGDSEFYEKVMKPLKEHFQFGREDTYDFHYVGLHVRQENDCIITDQNRFVDSLESPNIEDYVDRYEKHDTLIEEDQKEFRAIIGKIGWLSQTSRPDLAFDNLVLSTKLGNATFDDMKHAIKIIKKMNCEDTEMKFADLGDPSKWSIVGYGDAGYKSLPDKVSSCGGHVVLLCNKDTKLSCVVSWKSKKLKRVVSSSTAAEALAVNDTLDEMVYIRSVLSEIFGGAVEIPMELITDSRNLYQSVHSSTLVENPRLRLDVAKLQESIKSGELSDFKHESGKSMLANVLTKKGASPVQLLSVLRQCKV